MSLGILMLCAGCGQKGPLYLPDHRGSVVTRPAGAASPGTPPTAHQEDTNPQTTTTSAPAPQGPTDAARPDDGGPDTDSTPPPK